MASDLSITEADMDKAIEWFQIHFFNDEYDDSIEDSIFAQRDAFEESYLVENEENEENEMPKNTLDLQKYGTIFKISFILNRYLNNNSLAILMIDWSEGYPEDFADLTVNISMSGSLPEDTQFVDVNNLGPEIMTWITDNGLGEPTEIVGSSGYVTYPAVRFNIDKLNEYGTSI